MTVSYPELRRQGANVVQARPGRVIAYAGNPATRAALEADGVGVDTFEARELWAWHGGPHCLTQPLERS
jgi:arginine deiminase